MNVAIIDDISITIARKNIRSIRLVVGAKDAKVRLSAPFSVNDNMIMSFLESRRKWLTAAVEKATANLLSQPQSTCTTGDTLKIFDETLTLTVYETQKKTGVIRKDGALFLLTKPHCSQKKRQDMLYKWYKITLETQLSACLAKWENATKLVSSGFAIRNTTSRWGSCNVKTRKLSFSLQLIHKPLACLDYIVVHELAHISVPNHSAKFYSVVASALPNYKILQKLLK